MATPPPRPLPLNTHLAALCPSPHLRLPPQYLSAPARCSASSRPPPSWRRSTSRGRGARTRCRPATGSTSCRGRRTAQRCFMSTPPGTTTGRTGPPPPTSEWGGGIVRRTKATGDKHLVGHISILGESNEPILIFTEKSISYNSKKK